MLDAQEFDIIREVYVGGYTSQRALANNLGCSIGKVNTSLANAVKEGYLREEFLGTELLKNCVEKNKPKNAVILAAGYGLRMIPINQSIPKGLIEINGEPMIERLIKQLHEVGITDISIVTGYMKEAYEHLSDKFDVKLIYNRDYEFKNNLYTLAKVENQISNTYIVPCDVYCEDNPFSEVELYSWYAVTDMVDDDSYVRVTRTRELMCVDLEKSGNAMVGISYISAEDAPKLIKNMQNMYGKKAYFNSFWEDALVEDNKYFIPAKVISANTVYEINTYEQLRELDYSSKQLVTELLEKIAEKLNCKVEDIKDIECMKKGMSNRSFQFNCLGKRYVMRIPGVGTDRLMNRAQEYDVYQAIDALHIADPVIWFDREEGYKLTAYIENNRVSDQFNKEDVRNCMKMLRKFHGFKLKVNHEFNLYERINYYESCWDGSPSAYVDYQLTKDRIWELKDYIDAQPKELQLCHIDVAAENFLVIMDDEGNDKEVRMIDWEYAGMNDHDVDIAFWALYGAYEKEQTDELIDMYYPEGIDYATRVKIYCYVATCGLTWSNYCEYKALQGIDYGEYSLIQYQFAKKYYKIAKKAMEEL